jgi:hypothetical protein
MVVYPMAFSDMLPVWRNSMPEVFDQFHMRRERRRAWTFCCVSEVSSPPTIVRATSSSRLKASSIGTTLNGAPSSSQMVRALSEV